MWGADVTTAIMTNFTRLTAVAINYRDGYRAKKEGK